jgi:hypothetical protein
MELSPTVGRTLVRPMGFINAIAVRLAEARLGLLCSVIAER